MTKSRDTIFSPQLHRDMMEFITNYGKDKLTKDLSVYQSIYFTITCIKKRKC